MDEMLSGGSDGAMVMGDPSAYHHHHHHHHHHQQPLYVPEQPMGPMGSSAPYGSPQSQPPFSAQPPPPPIMLMQQQAGTAMAVGYGGGASGLAFGRSPQGQGASPPAAALEVTTTSEDSDDSTPHSAMMAGMKRPSPEPADNALGKVQKKPKVQKKKKKRDPNEPQKPVSAYALFFRDTQAAIKGQNPNASFGEVSKIVASMWDALDAEHKNVYKKKTEAAKKEYLKALAAYRASLVSKGAAESDNVYGGYSSYGGGGYSGYSPPSALPSPPMPSAQPQQPKQPQPMAGMMGTAQQQGMMMGSPVTGHMQQTTHMTQGTYMQQVPQPPPHHLSPPHSGSTPPPVSSAGPAGGNGVQGPTVAAASQQQQPPRGSGNACIRHGCPNAAITNSEWEDEYCSNECVVSHCRDVFSSWVASNQNASQNFSTVK